MTNSLKQKAYNEIKSKILNCQYPPQTFLNEDLLCKEYNVSRTPIRDALSRLEQENLVQIISKKGIIVAPLTIKEINIIYETRVLLEPYILSTYGCRINDSIEARIHEIQQTIGENQDNIQKVYELDDEYHHIIVDLCDNKYLIQCYSNIYAQNLRLRIISGNVNKERLLSSHQEHVKITNYILQKNYEKAADALKDHLLVSKDAAFKAIIDGNISI